MGIDGQWKHRFREKWPECFLQCIPLDKIVHVIIEDYSLRIYKFVYKCKDPRDVAINSCKWLMNNYTPGIETIIVLFDEHSPPAKKPKQESRDKSKNPLTLEEIKTLKINISDINGYMDQNERILRTPSLKHKLHYLCSKHLLSLDFSALFSNNHSPYMQQQQQRNKKFCLWIDGARINEHKNFIDEPKCCVISHPDKSIMCIDSFGIGESDLKVVNHISRNRGKTIVVSSYDGDMIPILLLNMRDWISRDTGMLDVQVYLDLCVDMNPRPERCNTVNGTATTKKKEDIKFDIIDINKLWISMIMGSEFPILKSMPYPIETICMLIILCETDFVEGLQDVGITTIWTAFHEKGYSILKGDEIIAYRGGSNNGKPATQVYSSTVVASSKREMLDFLDDIENMRVSNHPSENNNNNSNKKSTTSSIRDGFQAKKRADTQKKQIVVLPSPPPQQQSKLSDTIIIFPRDNPIKLDRKVFGDSNIRHEIELEERRWWLFLLHVIHYRLFKCAPDLSEVSKVITKINQKITDDNKKRYDTAESKKDPQDINNNNNNKPVRAPKTCEVINEMKLHSLVRRMHWNMDYWINGGKPIIDNVLDCLKINPMTGLSIHGWLEEKVPEDNMIECEDDQQFPYHNKNITNKKRQMNDQNDGSNKKFKTVVRVAHVVHTSNHRGWNSSMYSMQQQQQQQHQTPPHYQQQQQQQQQFYNNRGVPLFKN